MLKNFNPRLPPKNQGSELARKKVQNLLKKPSPPDDGSSPDQKHSYVIQQSPSHRFNEFGFHHEAKRMSMPPSLANYQNYEQKTSIDTLMVAPSPPQAASPEQTMKNLFFSKHDLVITSKPQDRSLEESGAASPNIKSPSPHYRM